MRYAPNICKVKIREEGSGDNEKYAYMTAVISSGAVDSYGTYFTDDNLRQFANQLNTEGIQLKDSHRQGQGFGVSESGEFKDGKVIGTFRIMRNWDLNDASFPNSNQFIEAIEEGLIRETSVGFSGGKFRSTTKKDENGKEKDVLSISESSLSEVSMVPKGANPDAQIIQQRMKEYPKGDVPLELKSELELKYGVRLDDVPIKNEERQGGSNMEAKELQEQLDAVTKERDEANAKVTELEVLAEDGREARKYMTQQALEAFKVSRGEALQTSEVERFEKRSANLNFEDLRLELEHLRTLAPEKPNVKSGSKTTQPDNSGSSDDKRSDEPQFRAVNPPGWGVRLQ